MLLTSPLFVALAPVGVWYLLQVVDLSHLLIEWVGSSDKMDSATRMLQDKSTASSRVTPLSYLTIAVVLSVSIQLSADAHVAITHTVPWNCTLMRFIGAAVSWICFLNLYSSYEFPDMPSIMAWVWHAFSSASTHGMSACMFVAYHFTHALSTLSVCLGLMRLQRILVRTRRALPRRSARTRGVGPWKIKVYHVRYRLDKLTSILYACALVIMVLVWALWTYLHIYL